MSTVVEVLAPGPVKVVEVIEPAPAAVIEVAAIAGPPGPPGPGNLVTFQTGHEPPLVGVPDGTLWVEWA